jgi:hypothetical protein
MTTKELIQELQKCPPETEVKIGIDRICWAGDIGLAQIEPIAEDPHYTEEDLESQADAESIGDMIVEKGTEYPRVILWISYPW